mmetsp:Transcript_118471/g.342545  ORF Transcript_118471/g.342545 Transcript_118471/m.342545 type:complete len:224 (-) Transcript_118471:518-1189(-)
MHLGGSAESCAVPKSVHTPPVMEKRWCFGAPAAQVASRRAGPTWLRTSTQKALPPCSCTKVPSCRKARVCVGLPSRQGLKPKGAMAPTSRHKSPKTIREAPGVAEGSRLHLCCSVSDASHGTAATYLDGGSSWWAPSLTNKVPGWPAHCSLTAKTSSLPIMGHIMARWDLLATSNANASGEDVTLHAAKCALLSAKVGKLPMCNVAMQAQQSVCEGGRCRSAD